MEILASRVLIRPADYATSVTFYRDAIGLAIAREYGAGTVFYAGQSLIELAGHGRDGDGSTVPFPGALWLQRSGTADLVVNATPCGLHPETDPLPVDIAGLRPGMIVCDIIMKPRETPLLQAAVAAGCDVRYGAGMLDSQLELMLEFFGY